MKLANLQLGARAGISVYHGTYLGDYLGVGVSIENGTSLRVGIGLSALPMALVHWP